MENAQLCYILRSRDRWTCHTRVTIVPGTKTYKYTLLNKKGKETRHRMTEGGVPRKLRRDRKFSWEAPYYHRPKRTTRGTRRCPLALREEVKRELDKMVEIDVIERISKPTDWVSSLAYSRKSSGKIRICLDPKNLNEAIRRPHYPTPTLEEMTFKLEGAKVFSKLDARSGYWSVTLDDESSTLTTFNTPFGRFRFKRMTFGLNLSQDIFQERMDIILETCPGTISIPDDIGVYGRGQKEHDENLINLMRVAKKNGLVFNEEKCAISTNSLSFFGLTFDDKGVHPNKNRIKAIEAFKEPQNPTELREFL